MFYLINKEKGISSFGALKMLKKRLQISKMGHTGTLDPLATGLLLVATGKYTKFIQFIDKEIKTYEFDFNINGESSTGDLEGEIKYFDKKKLDNKKRGINIDVIKKILELDFIGKISQIPPKYSAIKINGEKAYKKARKGEDFEMKQREIEIFSYKLIDYSFPTIKLEMTVSAGTYIRTIAEDIGKKLGLSGYVTRLHRTKIGNLSINNAKKIDNIEINDGLDLGYIFENIPKISINQEEYNKLKDGIKIIKEEFEDGLNFLIYENKYISLIKSKKGDMEFLVNGI